MKDASHKSKIQSYAEIALDRTGNTDYEGGQTSPPDPELGAIVLRHGDNARTGPPSPINADFARGGEIHSSLTRESAKAFQPAHSQKLVRLSRSTSPESEEDLARMQQGPLPNPEPLVIAQLIQWKFAAEEGSVTLRIPAVLGSIFLMLSTVLPYLFLASFFTAGHMILSIFVVSHGLLICIIDGRSNFTRDPLGSRAKFRNFATRHLNVLRMVWGRGILYVLVGIVNMAHELYICYISGSIMVLIGLIAMFTGVRAYRNLLTLRRALTDENFLWLEFIKHDVGHHGYLNPSEFAQFISDLGLEFDDLYTLKAFNTIDSNHDQRVTFREFELWWSQVRLNNDVLIL